MKSENLFKWTFKSFGRFQPAERRKFQTCTAIFSVFMATGFGLNKYVRESLPAVKELTTVHCCRHQEDTKLNINIRRLYFR